jgi:serine/threonine protein phosphatase PrpC
MRTALTGHRVEEAGGYVKGNRVQGKLTVTRSFGDMKFKNADQLCDGVVTSQPDIVEIDITTHIQYVLLACDGLWEKVSSATAVRYVNKKLTRGASVDEITKELVKHAITKGSKDNITVMLVLFDHVDAPLRKPERLVVGAVTTQNTDPRDSAAKSASSMNKSTSDLDGGEDSTSESLSE